MLILDVLNFICICISYYVIIRSLVTIPSILSGAITVAIGEILNKRINWKRYTQYEVLGGAVVLVVFYYLLFYYQLWKYDLVFLWASPLIMLLLYIVTFARMGLAWVNSSHPIGRYYAVIEIVAFFPIIYLVIIGTLNNELISEWSIKYGIIVAVGAALILSLLYGKKLAQDIGKYEELKNIKNGIEIYLNRLEQSVKFIGDPIEKMEFQQLINQTYQNYEDAAKSLTGGEFSEVESLLANCEIEVNQIQKEIQEKVSLFSKENISNRKEYAKIRLNKLREKELPENIIAVIILLENIIDQIDENVSEENDIKETLNLSDDLNLKIDELCRIVRFYVNINCEFDLSKEDISRAELYLYILESLKLTNARLSNVKEDLITLIDKINVETDVTYDELLQNYIKYKSLLIDLKQGNSTAFTSLIETYYVDIIHENIIIIIPKVCSTTKNTKGVIIHKNQEEFKINIKSLLFEFTSNQINLKSENDFRLDSIQFIGKQSGNGIIIFDIDETSQEYNVKILPSKLEILQSTFAFAVPISALSFPIIWYLTGMEIQSVAAISAVIGGGLVAVIYINKLLRLRKYF